MSITEIAAYFSSLPLSEFIRSSTWAFPVIESIHVVAIICVVASISVVDLRLIGLASTSVPVTRMTHETLRLTWVAFAFAVITGALMVIAKAEEYAVIPSFWLKFASMGMAGVNMIFFHFFTLRSVHDWDVGRPTPAGAKIAGALSLLFWILVVVFGRWIGYTTGFGAVFGNGF